MNSIHILHVEDSEADILLMQDAMEELHLAHHIEVVRNGYEAIQFLEKKGDYQDKFTPDLILLDINMPLMDGHELLEFIKKNPRTKHIPVLMLTTSSSQTDIMKSYQEYANSYIVKPHNVDDFASVANAIESFWMKVASLPENLRY
ncbi:response regulator [Parasediminibacterium sp. JCM 36343]|uniref:response regulator n=1 Tax=Parasediminibacterium sp. JCM 36343 TaxID=3374279 RepID=UPI003979F6E8